MINCALRDKRYSIDFVSGRALRELEPAAKMYAKVVHLSELAAKGEAIPEDAKFTISEAMDTMIRWFCTESDGMLFIGVPPCCRFGLSITLLWQNSKLFL